ncbi:MAG: hypothetical protein FGM54_10990, partial [Chitinophagaceae bacterium]|nr:hypothetical protein [Chitinophagaceae bacterium]
YKVRSYHIIKLDLQAISRSSMLTNRSLAVTNYSDKPLPQTITNSYVPGRNLLLLTHAAAYAEANGISDIYFGANADDGQCYPDCRMDFFNSFNQICQSCSNTANIKVHVPFIAMSKRDVVIKSKLLHVDLQNTLSCYAPIENKACGICLSCVQRISSIRAAKI